MFRWCKLKWWESTYFVRVDHYLARLLEENRRQPTQVSRSSVRSDDIESDCGKSVNFGDPSPCDYGWGKVRCPWFQVAMLRHCICATIFAQVARWEPLVGTMNFNVFGGKMTLTWTYFCTVQVKKEICRVLEIIIVLNACGSWHALVMSFCTALRIWVSPKCAAKCAIRIRNFQTLVWNSRKRWQNCTPFGWHSLVWITSMLLKEHS